MLFRSGHNTLRAMLARGLERRDTSSGRNRANGIFKGRGRRRIPGAIAPDRLNGKGLPPHLSLIHIFQTLYDLLCSQPEGEAVRLATALEIYVSGSLNVFNHETNVDLNRRLVCLDLKKLGAGLRTIAMLIMQDLVNSQVSMNFLRGPSLCRWSLLSEGFFSHFFRIKIVDRKSTRLNSSHSRASRMPSSA